jgi:hypothetical protein
MSRITVITDSKGNIAAMGHGRLGEGNVPKQTSKQPVAALRAGPGQILHEIELPEDVQHISNWNELHEKVKPHLKGSR